MNKKECINVKFSGGLGIFDYHYGYPEIDDQETYNGPTGKVVDIQVVHVGKLQKSYKIPSIVIDTTIADLESSDMKTDLRRVNVFNLLTKIGGNND